MFYINVKKLSKNHQQCNNQPKNFAFLLVMIFRSDKFISSVFFAVQEGKTKQRQSHRRLFETYSKHWYNVNVMQQILNSDCSLVYNKK